jgi:DUF4097 and DUF4098 domain-containing protein YvlB
VLIVLSSTTVVALMGAASPSMVIAQERRVEVRRVVGAIVDAAVAADVAIDVQAAAAAGQRRETRYPFQRDERLSRTVAIGPNGSLDLRNLSGRISVTGGSGRDATLEIVRVSRGRTEEDAARGLKEVTTEISHQGTRASVETRYPTQDRSRERDGYSVSVSYDITAPAGTSVSIHNLSGDVVFKNITGDIDVDVASGQVSIAQASRIARVKVLSGDITLTDVKGTTPVQVESLSGDVRAERVQAPRLTMTTISGDVTATDVTAEHATLSTTSGSVGYTGALARAGRYELQSHSGNVMLTVVGNAGFDLTARTFSGRVQPDANLGLKTRVVERREVRGTVGDGGATVQATTFSGDVTIVRK